ncbi:MAG: hypothetical protein ACK5NF_04095 [Bacilli bacterium]
MEIKIIKQTNKRLNYMMIDFYHIIIMAAFTLLYVFYVVVISSKGILGIIINYALCIFFYYILFAKIDGENSIVSRIIRNLKYILKKKYIVHEKGEYDLW